MMRALTIITLAVLLSGCGLLQDKFGDSAFGVVNTIMEKGTDAGDKVRLTAQRGATELCNIMRNAPEEHQAVRDWVWADADTGEQVGDRVHVICEGGLEQ